MLDPSVAEKVVKSCEIGHSASRHLNNFGPCLSMTSAPDWVKFEGTILLRTFEPFHIGTKFFSINPWLMRILTHPMLSFYFSFPAILDFQPF